MKTYFILILLVVSHLCFAQQTEYSTRNKKAIRLFEVAMGSFDRRDDANAILYSQQAISVDKKFIEPHLLLAEIYSQQYKFEEELNHYRQVLEIDPDFSSRIYYTMAKTEYKIGFYNDALDNLNKYFTYQERNPRIDAYAEYLIQRVEFAVYAKDNPVNLEPKIVENVSTEYDDYWPSLTADERMLVTTILIPIDNRFPLSDRNKHEDLFICYKQDDGSWSRPMNMGPPVNTKDNEGAQSFRSDGLQLFFTVCNRREDYGSCDIYYSNKINGRWTEPKNIGPPINTASWEAHPSVTADGRALYFACGNCEGGLGKSDIYVSYLNTNGTWSKPENLGDSINTFGNEMSPFIHPDGKTLYFSSDGWIGMGGMDIFVSRKKDDGTWSTPVNLGYPVNTHGDEVGLVVNARGDYAYFSSNRPGSQKLDIYGFDLPVQFRPNTVTYVKGLVYNAINKNKLQASFELIDLSTGEVIIQSQSAIGTGEFLVCLPLGKDYALNVSKEGYLFFSENYSLSGAYNSNEPFIMDVPLQPITLGASIVLKNVFFKTDSYELDEKSCIELDKLVNLMNDNKNIKIELAGHTDNQGSYDYNQNLSTNRAKSVYNYIASQGIALSRLKYAGYSFSKPIATNDTPEGRSLNRRTEFTIFEIQ